MSNQAESLYPIHVDSDKILHKQFKAIAKLLPYETIKTSQCNQQYLTGLINKQWISCQNGLTFTFTQFIVNKEINASNFIKEFNQSELDCRQSRSKLPPVISKLIKITANIFSYFCYLNIKNPQKIQEQLAINSLKPMFFTLEEFSNGNPSNNFINKFKILVNDDNILISTLAAEILTLCALPTVPLCIKKLTTNEKSLAAKLITSKKVPTKSNTIDNVFEQRINVNSYHYFEYVHPAYARQVVVMYRFINKYAANTEHAIDVGSGTGSALLLLAQLLKNITIDAIEPSATAYRYLESLSKKITNIQITPIKIPFLHYTAESKVKLLLSTGASHHFDTLAFMDWASSTLENDGILIIADEFISPYSSILERKKHLILHHIAYMLPIISPIDMTLDIDIHEENLVLLLDLYIPIAYHLAQNDNVLAAEQTLKQLLAKIREHHLHDYYISQENIAFYRLILLELEALTAGLDYEVEQKTYLDNIITMATHSHFKLLSHEQVFSTHGDNKTDAGTHVLAFKRG